VASRPRSRQKIKINQAIALKKKTFILVAKKLLLEMQNIFISPYHNLPVI